MAQKNATPSKTQAEVIKRNGLNPLIWTVMKEYEHSMIVLDRFTGDVKVIDK